MSSLYERFRPSSWEQVIGQDKAVGQVLTVRDTLGLGGNAFFFSGGSGTGKSTIARLLAHEVADPFNVETYVARCLTPADMAHMWAGMRTHGIPLEGSGLTGRAILIDEVHGLKKACVEVLLKALEPIPEHCVWCFTTTVEGKESLFEDVDDAHPLLSRCIQVQLSQRGLAEAFAVRLKSIAVEVGLDGQPLERYVRLMKDVRNNFREGLEYVAAGKMKTAG
jgi:replication-associated recombination protein RarA